jgi:hypothetical protein
MVGLRLNCLTDKSRSELGAKRTELEYSPLLTGLAATTTLTAAPRAAWAFPSLQRPPLEVADIVRAMGKKFIENSRAWITAQHLKVLRAIERCRTATFTRLYRERTATLVVPLRFSAIGTLPITHSDFWGDTGISHLSMHSISSGRRNHRAIFDA